jgi:hypothetical protein
MLKVPPKAPKSEPKSRSLSETVLSDAVGRGPTASFNAPWSPVPVILPLPMLRGCAARGPALPTARSVGRRSAICRTPPASPARRSQCALPTGCRPAPCGDRCTGVPQAASVGYEALDHLPLCVALSGASSGERVVGCSPIPSSSALSSPLRNARLAARLAFLQRLATAWCARLHADHPSRKALFSSSS